MAYNYCGSLLAGIGQRYWPCHGRSNHGTGTSSKIGIRNGDTDTAERLKQKKNMPEVLIITPESLHLLLAQKKHPEIFSHLRIIAVDEWHEILGSKRGVQVELALSRMVHCRATGNQPACVWGISATIGNLTEAKDVLLAPCNKRELLYGQPLINKSW